jgi:two-component system cell cycle response regulator
VPGEPAAALLPPARRSAEPKGAILVVDDEAGIARMLQVLLENRGFAVHVALGGREALEVLGTKPVDLMLLDVMMPEMDGYEVCRAVKGDERHRTLPVVMLTAKGKVQDKIYGLGVGADDYIAKPFDNQELVARINVLLRMSRMSREIMRRNEELSALNAIAATVSGSLALNEILEGTLAKVLELFQAQEGGIYLVGLEKGGLELVLKQGLSFDPEPLFAAVRVDEGPVIGLLGPEGEVIATTERVAPEDVAGRFRSFAVVPLKSKNQLMGLLPIIGPRLRPFGPQDLDLLGAIGGVIGVAVENLRLFEETRKLAVTDELTGLYNHRYFYQTLARESRRAQRYHRELSVIMLDIDNFKAFNDRHGHLAGDRALRRLALILRQNARDVDVVVRYGGEEFAVILPEAEAAQAAIQAERIRSAVERAPFRDGGPAGELTVSGGIGTRRPQMPSLEELILAADQALYRAKAQGRNRVCSADQMGGPPPPGPGAKATA